MIKIVDIKTNENQTSTHIFLKFEDTPVNKELYTYLKEELDKFKLYTDNDYSTKLEIKYDEILETLTMEITIIIPVKIMPKELDKSVEIIMYKINLFRNFYEAHNVIYMNKISL
ncbi:hypothetical protein [Methanobacterium sp. SMA-27]|uniref:hypothetical protein n=1 Tax=Methanobacterium sp. SMA-27 TaxID=1495336 RepID=UPI00064F4F53|nr:hypothetical protein [Methanobacterium sp. SMA-27]